MNARPNVLLVDDRPDNLLALEAQLRGLETHFLKACSGSAALDLLLENDVAVAIIDVQMPEMDGFELAELMRGSPRTSSIPILFVTAGLHDRSRVFKGYEAGAVDFLIKPTEPHVLANKIRVFLQLHNQNRALTERLQALEQAHAALRESAEQSRRQLAEIQAIYDSAHVGLCVFDREMRFVRINTRMAEINGVPADEHQGKTIEEVVPSLAMTAREIADRIFLTGEGVKEIEFTGTTRSDPGVERTWVEQWLPLKGPSGEVWAVNVVAEEITERKQAEHALRESEKRYRRLFEHMAEGFFLAEVIWSETGDACDARYLEVNAAFEKQVGLKREQVVGRTMRELFPSLDDAWLKRFAAVAKTGVPDRIDAFLGTDGSVYSTVTYSPCPGQFACVFQDISERKKAEDALRASEEVLRTVVENSRDGINMLDLGTGKYVFMSPAQVELTGFTSDEIRDFPVDDAYERVHPEDREISIRQQKEITAGRDLPGPVEYRWKVKSGEYRWFADSRKLVRDPQGNAVALVGVSRDITERKRMEAALRKAKSLSEALNHIGEAVHASLNVEEVIRRVLQEGTHALGSESAAFSERVTGGWRVVHVEGMPRTLIGSFMNDDDEIHAALAVRAQRPIAIDDAFTDERVNREHLRRHDVRSVLTVPLIRSGEPLGVMFFNYHTQVHVFEPSEIDFARQLGVSASIALQNAELFAERQDREQALRARESRLGLLSRTAGALLRAEDPQRVIEELCQAVVEHLDCQAFFNFLVDRDARRLRLNACAGVPASEAARIEWLDFGVAICGCVARDGQRLIAEDILRGDDSRASLVRSYGIQAYCCHPLVGQGGEVLGTLSFGTKTRAQFREDEIELMRVVADQVATAIQRLEARKALNIKNAQLLEADRRKNEFLAVLSHELRNPLAPIKNSLYILDRAAPGGDQARRAKEVIDRQVNQLARLIDDLLDVTRVTRNKVVLQQANLELNDLVMRAVEDQRSLLEGNGLALELQLPKQKFFVHGDGSRLAQVVSNLLQNAAKFTPRGGNVKVLVEPDGNGERARLLVRDDGVGMTPETLARLFEPFMQADASLDRSKGGLGLGLALVKGLVELHGGDVGAHSDGLGRGSEFVVRIPLVAMESAEHTASAKAMVCAPQRVLIIEDNIDAADSLCEALSLGDHEVEVAYNGPEGLAKARTFKPALVLCDIGLPGMDGYAVARAFRADEELSRVCLVALTGYALPEDLQKAKDAGFERHLAKPPRLQALESLLAELMTRRAPVAAVDGQVRAG